MSLSGLKLDKSWTLFLDRDGTINRRIVDGYVTRWEEFEFIPRIEKALVKLAGIFGHIFIVTNQQGVGKGIMTVNDLENLHQMMLGAITGAGGRIDRIYYCTARKEENSFYRKPNAGMALLARREFPGVNFRKSVMVGDMIHDMRFGKRLGMYTVLTGESSLRVAREYPSLVDFRVDTIADIPELIK